MNFHTSLTTLRNDGSVVIPNFYSETEIEAISHILETKGKNVSNVDTKNLFAIRQLIKQIPELKPLLFNDSLCTLLDQNYGEKCFLTKGIYFNKPSVSNWFVAYHQDLSISVKDKYEAVGYFNWTHKKGQYGVQPPVNILEDTLTIRIHLDDTTAANGALRVIPKSHSKGIIRNDALDSIQENEIICEVPKGGIMLMKPLTLHASNRTTNGKERRVIHLEFCPHLLQSPLEWLEAETLNRFPLNHE